MMKAATTAATTSKQKPAETEKAATKPHTSAAFASLGRKRKARNEKLGSITTPERRSGYFMPSKAKFPPIKAVSGALFWRTGEIDHGDSVDVRLQVYETGEWAIRVGPSDYDQDHQGYWGASSLTRELSVKDCREIARDLIDQAKEQAAAAA